MYRIVIICKYVFIYISQCLTQTPEYCRLLACIYIYFIISRNFSLEVHTWKPTCYKNKTPTTKLVCVKQGWCKPVLCASGLVRKTVNRMCVCIRKRFVLRNWLPWCGGSVRPKPAEQASRLEAQGTEVFWGGEKGKGRRKAIAIKGSTMRGSIKIPQCPWYGICIWKFVYPSEHFPSGTKTNS